MSAPSLTLLQQHSEFLHARAVADDVAVERGYRSVTRKTDLAALGFGRAQQIVPALVIPIRSVRGAVESYQLRPDSPRPNDKGKPRKYEIIAGARMLIDFHPRLTRSREGEVPLISDPSVPLFITEGIPKADAAVSLGLCCGALLGVFNFRGTNEVGGKTALADWESVALNDRPVYIALDSDVTEKPQVHGALVRLKALLESRRAKTSIIYLPTGEHGEKTGLDDYIAHAKTAGRSDAEIRDALRVLATPKLRKLAAQVDDGRPEILIVPGQQPGIVDAAERVLVANAARLSIFQRAGEVVRVVCLKRQIERGGLRRPHGNIQLAPVLTLNLQEIFDRLIAWKRTDPQNGDKPVDCPTRIAATYLARPEWRLPLLTGIIETPIMRPDGTILGAGGYDEATGLYFHCGEQDWPDIPTAPTRADAEAALHELQEPFSEFPFVDDAAGSVLIAGILTAIQRRLLESAPLFAFAAPAQRSGKSMLAESLGIISTGRKPAATGVAKEPDELRKAITSALRENQAIINLDNITRPLDSPDLARAITQSEYADRLLGANRMLRLPTNVLWTATGNNFTCRGDLPSRTLVSRIDAERERPEERTFRIADLPAHIIANRKPLVAAALTILRAYHVAGRPRQNVRPWGGFAHWSRDIREPLVWLGLADPCATREQIIVNDPDRELTAEVLRSWYAAFGDCVMLVRNVVTTTGDGEHDELKQALLTVAAKRDDSDQIDVRRLGAWCSSIAARVIDGLRLTPDRKIRRAQGWRVSDVSCVSSKPVGENGQARTHSDAQGGQTTKSACAPPSFDRREINSPDSPDSPDVEIEEGSL